MKKKLLSIFSLIMACSMIVLTACAPASQSSGPEQPEKQDERSAGDEKAPSASAKTEIIMGLTRGISSIWPGGENDQGTVIMNNQFWNNLVRKNFETGEIEPELAKSWNISEDNLTYTFELRDDVYFHNGVKMTAEDVAWSLNEWHKYETYTKDYLVFFNNAEVIDEYTVALHYDKIYAAALEGLSMNLVGIMNKEYTLEKMGTNWDSSENAQSRGVYGEIDPMGTGPYKFASKVSGESYTMEANEQYFEGAPAFKKVTVKIMTDANAALMALESGEIDALSHAPASDKMAIESNPDLVWYQNSDTPMLIWLMLNKDNEYLKNDKVRQAIAYALDKEEIAIGTTDGVGGVLHSPIPTAATGYSDAVSDYEQDLEKAKQLLAEAGYPNGFTIEMKTYNSNTYKKPSEIIQAQLAKIGIDIKVVIVDTFWSDVAAHDFNLGVMNLCIYVPDADQALYPLYYSGQKRNYVNVRNPELDRMLDEARGETDVAVRTELYAQAQQIFHDDLFMIPLCNYVSIIAANKNVKNVVASPVFAWDIKDWTWE
ncbi:ABC transporter substrate-binding protein [Sedimentibacter hydroxybenzoicus DSM 7310]|uniref:ABC transporter substrate-binding protein n=1 Tax=Sedimentibacter hydroxybenzoicus DSM 7310 TaxID=1123245 RepID=A0A974BGX4_SEDHY|nr:ABC transporter substrate-binding protein [Sedimentibacter hydroxybenzoicus]NYB72721.1 ABC transporter substrate-binding protein [Sedimentibacter hydroxybenzoicus DSM 7310]